MSIQKAIVSAVVAFIGALVVALGTGNTETIGSLDLKRWLLVALAVLGSGGIVWLTENTAAHPYVKAVVGFLSAGIASLVTALDDNVITQAEWLVAFSAAVAGAGFVYQIRNGGPPQRV